MRACLRVSSKPFQIGLLLTMKFSFIYSRILFRNSLLLHFFGTKKSKEFSEGIRFFKEFFEEFFESNLFKLFFNTAF